MVILAFVGIGLLLAYEVYAMVSVRPNDTISEVLWRLSERPIVPFLFGLLMGHLFWRR